MAYIEEKFRCPECNTLNEVEFDVDLGECIDYSVSYEEEVECEECECVFEAKAYVSCDIDVTNSGTKLLRKSEKNKPIYDPNDISTWQDAENPNQLGLFA